MNALDITLPTDKGIIHQIQERDGRKKLRQLFSPWQVHDSNVNKINATKFSGCYGSDFRRENHVISGSLQKHCDDCQSSFVEAQNILLDERASGKRKNKRCWIKIPRKFGIAAQQKRNSGWNLVKK